MQKPSRSWKTGPEYLSVLSQTPSMTVSRTPSLPNIHSVQLELLDWKMPPTVLSTQFVDPASTANCPSAQISNVGMTSHCDSLSPISTGCLARDPSGTTIFTAE